MDYRLLGRSGLKVSTLTMGTMTFGGVGFFAKAGAQDVTGATRLVDLCLEAGVNLMDTANAYSNGLSEEIIGEILSGDGRRQRMLIATKVRFPMGDGVNERGLSRHHIIASCEASLKRLRTDVIDLFQLHEWDGETPIEETMRALDDLVTAGKIRYVGCSNFSGWHIMKANATADRADGVRFVSQQIHYTLEAREAEYELVPVAIDQGLGILVWSPLACGLLSGKYRRDAAAPEGTRRFAGWTEPPIRDEDRLWRIVDALVAVADGRGVSAAQVALAWLIGKPGVTSAIIGGRTEAQFVDNLKAADLKLTDEERATLDAVSQPPLIYPYWHQVSTARDRLGPADLAFLKPYL